MPLGLEKYNRFPMRQPAIAEYFMEQGRDGPYSFMTNPDTSTPRGPIVNYHFLLRKTLPGRESVSREIFFYIHSKIIGKINST